MPPFYKERLLAFARRGASPPKVWWLSKPSSTAPRSRTAPTRLERLAELIRGAAKTEKARRPTKPTLGSKKRRLEGKSIRGTIKAGRGKVDF